MVLLSFQLGISSCIGGIGVNRDQFTPTNTVERYSCATNVVQDKTPIIEVRWNAQAVSIHCKIFVMGGVGGKSLVLSICEVFLFKNNKFSLFLPLTIARRCFRIAVNAAEIVCTGVYIKSYREFTQIKSSKVNNVVDGT